MATRGVRVGQDAMIRLLAALAAMGLACAQAVAGTPQFRLADGLSAEARQATGQLLAQAAGKLPPAWSAATPAPAGTAGSPAGAAWRPSGSMTPTRCRG